MNFQNKKVIIFGTGSAAAEWVYKNTHLDVAYFIDNDENKCGKYLFGKSICLPIRLLEESLTEVLVIVASAYVEAISTQLERMGLRLNENYLIGSAPDAYLLDVNFDLEDFFNELNKINLRYVVIRNYDALPALSGGDVDLLVHDEDINKLINSRMLNQTWNFRKANELPRIKIDIYSVYGTVGFRYKNMAMFHPKFAQLILETRTLCKNLFYIPSVITELNSYLYYVAYFKAEESGLSLDGRPIEIKENKFWSCADRLSNHVRYNYFEKIMAMLGDVKLFDLTIRGIHEYLKSIDCAPAVDTLRRLVGWENFIKIYEPNLFQGGWCAEYIRRRHSSNGLIVYFIRARAVKINAEKYILNFLQQSNLRLICEYDLNPLDNFEHHFRGGNWADDYGIFLNGPPVKLLFLHDQNLDTLNSSQKRMSLPFVEYKSYFIKSDLRNALSQEFRDEKSLNLFHSTDDCFESFFVLSKINKVDRDHVINIINTMTDMNISSSAF